MMQNPTDLLFVEGYKQRTLLSLYEITRDEKYLDPVRTAAAKILAAQKPQGYWYSGWKNDIYFADTGSALAFLANYYKHADRNELIAINGAFKAYLDLVLKRGDTTGKPFVHKAGSVGIGFQGDEKGGIKNSLNQPYTISTALTGAELFSALYYITGEEEYKWIAIRACGWILDTMAVDGKIPYIWDQGVEEWEPNQQNEDFIWNAWPYDTSAYVGEGLIAAWTYIAEPPFRQHIAERIRPHIEWLLRTQNADGSWAKPLSQDQRRSHGVVNLLNWYYHNISPDPRVARAIRKYYVLILDPARGKYLNIPGDPVATALAGRALAEIIKPGVDCRRWMEN
jgi:rhamnogalacturonyl hydrolase YesR